MDIFRKDEGQRRVLRKMASGLSSLGLATLWSRTVFRGILRRVSFLSENLLVADPV